MWLRLILIAFAFEGLNGITFMMVREFGLGSGRNTFILSYNLFVLILALSFFSKNKKRLRHKELLLGSLIGITMGTGIIFSMNALMQLPGIVYFPLISGGGLVSVAILSRIFWKERLAPKQILGLVLACLAVILIVLP